jgi:hypothetical protein
VDGEGVYAPIPPRASGVYAIASRYSVEVRYVGMSWTGRLRKTALRHFQTWKRDWMHPEPRLVYDPARHLIRWAVVAGGRPAVVAAERRAMLQFRPTDNALVPVELVEEEEVPF